VLVKASPANPILLEPPQSSLVTLLQCLKHPGSDKHAVLEALVRLTERRLQAVVHQRSANLTRHEIEDILQRVYLKVWQRAHTFRGELDAQAFAWLNTITRRETLDYVREIPPETSEADFSPAPDADSPGFSPLERLPDPGSAGAALDGFSAAACRDQRPVEDLLIYQQEAEKFWAVWDESEMCILERLQDGAKAKEIASEFGISAPAMSQRIARMQAKYQRLFHTDPPA
jgi:RNA polymerase sigma factor (sigma-70 family)